MKSFYCVILIVICTYGCSAPVKEYTGSFTVISKNHRFIDSLLSDSTDGGEQEVNVWMTLPDQEKFSPPFPAVVLSHSSWGLSSQEQFYASIFKQMGIATIVIDSFTPRGVRKTSLDQSRVSSASMINDAYEVLDYLKKSNLFQRDKIALMGFSKGGIVALYSAFEDVRVQFPEENSFAAHIAYYPWCGMRLVNMKLTGAPLLIIGGDKDIVTPVSKCQIMISEEVEDEQQSLISISELKNARHAFDHPVLARLPFPISMNAQVPANCEIRQRGQGEFYEVHSNEIVSGENIKLILEQCSAYNGVAGYNKEATQNALSITKEFLAKHLLSDYE